MAAAELTPELCARAVMDTVPRVMRFIRGEMRRRGAPFLSVPQFRALAFLHRNPGASLADVADHLGVTRPTASAVVDRLVRRGMVDRAAHPEERRRIVLTVTAAGLRHLDQAREATQSRMAAVLGGLSRAELEKLSEGIALLGSVFKEVATPSDRGGGSR